MANKYKLKPGPSSKTQAWCRSEPEKWFEIKVRPEKKQK